MAVISNVYWHLVVWKQQSQTFSFTDYIYWLPNSPHDNNDVFFGVYSDTFSSTNAHKSVLFEQ